MPLAILPKREQNYTTAEPREADAAPRAPPQNDTNESPALRRQLDIKQTPPPLWLDTIEGEELDSIESAPHEIPASQDGWRWVVSRGCKVAVLRGADSYAKTER